MPADFLSRSFAEMVQEVHLVNQVDKDPDFGLYQKQDELHQEQKM